MDISNNENELNNHVRIIDEFLSKEHIKCLTDFVLQQGHKQDIVRNKEIVSWFWKNYCNILKKYNITKIAEYVTVTNNNAPIKKHKDKLIGSERYKIFIYLNDVDNGGTVFYINDKEYLVENQMNRLVIFDMNLWHRGQSCSEYENNKILIGFRAT